MKSFWAAAFFWIGAAAVEAEEGPARSPASVTSALVSPKTVITSQKVNVLGRGQAVEFNGEVTLVRGGDRLTADRLVTEQGNNIAHAWGRVTLKRESTADNVTWEAWGDEAAYDTGTSSGTLWGVEHPARAMRSVLLDGRRVIRFRLASRRITFYQEREARVEGSTDVPSMAFADGGVYIRAEETEPRPRKTELWSANAFFDGVEKSLTLEGAFVPPVGSGDPLPPKGIDLPFSRQTQGPERREVSGEIIRYNPALRQLTVKRNAFARVYYEPGSE